MSSRDVVGIMSPRFTGNRALAPIAAPPGACPQRPMFAYKALIVGGTLLPGSKSFRGGGGGNPGSGMFGGQAPGGGGGSRQSLPQPRSAPNLVALASSSRRHSEGDGGGGNGGGGGGSGSGSGGGSRGGVSSSGMDGDDDVNDALVAMAAARVTTSETMSLMEDHLAGWLLRKLTRPTFKRRAGVARLYERLHSR